MTSLMSRSRPSNATNALFMAFSVSHSISSKPIPNASTSRRNSSVGVIPLIRRLSVFTVTRNLSRRRRSMGCSAMDGATPVWTLEVGHISSGIRRSRTYAASRPSAGRPSGRIRMSSTIRTPWPRRSAPQICSASQIEGSPYPSPAWIVKWKFSRAMSWNASRCAAGGNPFSGPAMSKPTTPSSRCRTASSAISRERWPSRIAVARNAMVIPRPALPRRKPSRTDPTTSSSVSPRRVQSSGAMRISA